MELNPLDLQRRGMIAYRKWGRGPCDSASVEEDAGRTLIAVRRCGATVAAYLVRSNKRLRRLDHWPVWIW